MERFKPLTYAVMHFTVAVTVAFAVTGSWAAALGVGIIEPMIQTVFYALHERAWSRWSLTRPRAAFLRPAMNASPLQRFLGGMKQSAAPSVGEA